MLERGIVCLVSGALALVFPVMCCPGFPGCFLERGALALVFPVMCCPGFPGCFLERGALALVFPVMCCPGFPGCFPESRPWVLSLGAVVIRHSLHVMSSVFSRDVHEQCLFWLCGVISILVGFFNHIMTRKLIWSPVVTHILSRLSVWVDWHTPLKDDGGRNRNCLLALLHQVCLGGGHPV